MAHPSRKFGLGEEGKDGLSIKLQGEQPGALRAAGGVACAAVVPVRVPKRPSNGGATRQPRSRGQALQQGFQSRTLRQHAGARPLIHDGHGHLKEGLRRSKLGRGQGTGKQTKEEQAAPQHESAARQGIRSPKAREKPLACAPLCYHGSILLPDPAPALTPSVKGPAP